MSMFYVKTLTFMLSDFAINFLHIFLVYVITQKVNHYGTYLNKLVRENVKICSCVIPGKVEVFFADSKRLYKDLKKCVIE